MHLISLFLIAATLGRHLASTEISIKNGTARISKYEPPEDLKNLFPFILLGKGYEDSPVWLMEFGKYELRTVLSKGPEETARLGTYFEFVIRTFFESGKNSSEDAWPIAVADLQGYGIEKAADIQSLRFFLSQASVFYRYAAGRNFKRIFAVNTSPIFQQVYTLLKPLLGRYAEAVEILGTNPSKWKPHLLKFIPGDQLPPFLGGFNRDFKPLAITG